MFTILSGVAGQKLTNVDGSHSEDEYTKTLLSLEDLCLADGLFSDVLFKLEDGTCSAHKPILMARSDMMCAMFTHEEIFKEASARVIHFPGVNKITFYQVKYLLEANRSLNRGVPFFFLTDSHP